MKLMSQVKLTSAGATNAADTQPLQQQPLDQGSLLLADVLRVGDELATTFFALIVLFTVISMTVPFDVRQSTLWTMKVVHGATPCNEIQTSPLEGVAHFSSTFQHYILSTTLFRLRVAGAAG